ncbi:MAG: YifB family Mg chelatase-like AAA ATPase [Candidatus Niyogibacteria bacterium]|nr:YifB family Mg chelatase-like AAA ATPase [Candidatus Niyogibacteria bacterium]
MSVKLHSAQIVGLKGSIIDVELDLSRGLRSFTIVGLPDKAVDEAKHRISYAIANIGFHPPHKKNQKVIASLAPADIKKEGPAFDLAIALAYLFASKQVTFNPEKRLFLGELALDGTLRPVKGILPLARKAKEEGFQEIFVPRGNGEEAALLDGIHVYEASTLSDIAEHLAGSVVITPLPRTAFSSGIAKTDIDMSDIRGQDSAKRALVIAASGSHNLGMVGPPGTGKTLLARALPGILPPLSFEEALEVTAIHSVAGVLDEPVLTRRPFRSPHHTSSYVSLVGGGAFPKPGEITLAHRGVLFADEFLEFDRRIIEGLRQPLEDGFITVARARGVLRFPARFMFIAAMNPCPCGNFRSKTKMCLCSPSSLFRYQRKISGPIADRIDLWCDVGQVEHEVLDQKPADMPTSKELRAQVMQAREAQKKRFANSSILTNSEMNVKDIDTYCILDQDTKVALLQAAQTLDLSARAYHRVLKISRTVADLAGSEHITRNHINEALQYRPRQNTL